MKIEIRTYVCGDKNCTEIILGNKLRYSLPGVCTQRAEIMSVTSKNQLDALLQKWGLFEGTRIEELRCLKTPGGLDTSKIWTNQTLEKYYNELDKKEGEVKDA